MGAASLGCKARLGWTLDLGGLWGQGSGKCSGHHAQYYNTCSQNPPSFLFPVYILSLLHTQEYLYDPMGSSRGQFLDILYATFHDLGWG